MTHRLIRRLLLVALAVIVVATPAAALDPAFDRWLANLWPEAQALGVSRTTFDSATRGLAPDLTLPDLVVPGRPQRAPEQPEFMLGPADYLRESALARLAEQGRTLAREHRATLAKIDQTTGVPPSIVLAIWARETSYGATKLRLGAIRVLATQAYYGRRKDMFRREFLLALKLMQEEHMRPEQMLSSWAGAMGQTQFLPSDFFKYAVDFDGDGHRDIWNSVPDTLASAAKQLAGKGWQRGQGWAYEVKAPARGDCSQGMPEITAPVAEWVRRGYAPVERLPPGAAELQASLLQPEGIYGPAFLTLKNYYVLKEYNVSDLYVLFVGGLSDRIDGGKPWRTPWSTRPPLRSEQVEDIQRRLAQRGLYADKLDGKAGMKTRAAIGAFQKAERLTLDCWPSTEVLGRLRGN